MRVIVFVLTIMLWAPSAGATDIEATCYGACEANTSSNPEYKACLERTANAADAALNKAYGSLKSAIQRYAGELGQNPSIQLQSLVAAQKKWIAYRDANCTFEDQLAFGGTAIGGNYSACLCALSLGRIADFTRMSKRLIPID